MDYIEFSNSIKEKYPYYKDADNGQLTKAMLEKFPYYRDKVDTSNIESDYQKKTEQMVGYPQNQPETYDKTAQVIFPRTSQTDPMIDPAKQQLTSLGLDLLSLPGRVSVSIPKTIKETAIDAYNTNPNEPFLDSYGNLLSQIPSRFVENVGMTETPSEKGFVQTVSNVAEDIARHPATVIPGPGRVGGVVAKIAPELTLAAKEAVPAIVQGLGRAGAEGATQIGIGEVGRMAKGEESTTGDRILEGTLGTALGVIPGLRSWGKTASDKAVGDVLAYKASVSGKVPEKPLEETLRMTQEIKSQMGEFYNPNKSFIDNLRTFDDLVKFYPEFAKQIPIEALETLQFVKDRTAGLKRNLGLWDYVATTIPFVKPAYIAGKSAKEGASLATNMGNYPIQSSIARGFGASLLDNLSRPAQDKVEQTKSKIDKTYTATKNIGNRLLGK